MIVKNKIFEDPRKKKLEKAEKKWRRWNRLPRWLKRIRPLIRFLCDTIHWCESEPLPVGWFREWLKVSEPAMNLIAEVIAFLKESMEILTNKEVVEISKGIASLQWAIDRNPRSGIYQSLMEIEKRTAKLYQTFFDVSSKISIRRR